MSASLWQKNKNKTTTTTKNKQTNKKQNKKNLRNWHPRNRRTKCIYLCVQHSIENTSSTRPRKRNLRIITCSNKLRSRIMCGPPYTRMPPTRFRYISTTKQGFDTWVRRASLLWKTLNVYLFIYVVVNVLNYLQGVKVHWETNILHWHVTYIAWI